MKISEKQLQFLYQVLTDSLVIDDGGSCPFCFNKQTRIKYADEIFNQQSDKLSEVKDE